MRSRPYARGVIGALACFVLAIAGLPAQVSVGARPPLLERLIVDKYFSKLPLRTVADFAPLDLALQEPSVGRQAGSRPTPIGSDPGCASRRLNSCSDSRHLSGSS